MPTIIVSIENTDYNMRVCISVNFYGLDNLIGCHRLGMEEHGDAIRRLRASFADYIQEYPNLPTIIDKKVNLVKLAKTNTEHYKLVKMLYKAVIKNKDLATILPQFKNKHKQIFNDKLELLEEATNKGWIDDGRYLEMVNNVKETYDKCMNEYDIFDKLITNPSALCVE
jgi:hypothetical protein